MVTVVDASKIDYESAAGHAYTVTAQASDGTLTSSQTFTIAVTDVAPSTPVDADVVANSVAEGAANGTAVGVTASSADINGGSVTYSLTDSAGGRFAINASSGVVTVADGTLLDFETATSHNYHRHRRRRQRRHPGHQPDLHHCGHRRGAIGAGGRQRIHQYGGRRRR